MIRVPEPYFDIGFYTVKIKDFQTDTVHNVEWVADANQAYYAEAAYVDFVCNWAKQFGVEMQYTVGHGGVTVITSFTGSKGYSVSQGQTLTSLHTAIQSLPWHTLNIQKEAPPEHYGDW